MKPQKVTDLQIAFPDHVEHLMPTDEPDWKEWRSRWPNGDSWGYKLFSNWFYSGLSSLHMTPKEGINTSEALAHIRCIMGSFEPKHEDKETACAYLFEHWFEKAEWTSKKKEKP